jgi:hypothetical protein
MKTALNDHQPSSDWLEQALQAHLTAKTKPAPPASPEFRARCRTAALGALDVLKMQQHRQQLAPTAGSLIEHFEALARLANVKLDAAFQTLGITCVDATDAACARGLALLAQHLGLACDEVVLRVRWGVAQLTGVVAPTEWPGTLILARPRRGAGSEGQTRAKRSLNRTLLDCEKNYSPARRAELRAALNAVAEVYGQDER